MSDAQDIGQQAGDQIASVGKKAGNKAKNVASKVGKKIAKKLAAFMIKLIMSFLKFLLAWLGPIGFVTLLVIIILLAVLSALPLGDWFLKGSVDGGKGERTQEEVLIDEDYKNQFIQLADASVNEIRDIPADEEWLNQLIMLSTPSWGIPAALAEYQILNYNEKKKFPDAKKIFNELEPRFTFDVIDTDTVTYKTVTRDCYREKVGVDDKGRPIYETTCDPVEISYNTESLPEHEVLSRVDHPYGSIDINPLIRYYPGGTVSRTNNWQLVSSTNTRHGGYVKIYKQWTDTQVDDRGIPAFNQEVDRFNDLLINKGVKEADIPFVYEMIATIDPYFYVDGFTGSVSRASFRNAHYTYDGAILDGWAYPIPENLVVTSEYGNRSCKGCIGSFHYGIDLGGSAANGLPVVAAYDGLVIRAEYSKSYGNVIYIAHENGLQTRYAHMQYLTIKNNEQVAAGDQIGAVGNTGNSTGPHLHFEVLKPGSKPWWSYSRDMEESYNPRIWLDQFLQ